jgi:hypothetical protein
MVTTKSLRHFAADCLVLARRTEDASQKQMFLEAARTWARTADVIDRYVGEAVVDLLPDLRSKLN